MDRFIGTRRVANGLTGLRLKSNMDRFIAFCCFSFECVFDCLKSNMDRFIDGINMENLEFYEV